MRHLRAAPRGGIGVQRSPEPSSRPVTPHGSAILASESARQHGAYPLKAYLPVDDAGVIDGFLRGTPAAVVVVDGWIDVAVRESGASLRGEWEDLKQEVRTRLFRNLSRNAFDGRSELRTYVHRIAKNVCIDLGLQKRRLSRVTVDPAEAGTIAAVDVLEKQSITRDLLARMLEGVTLEDRHLLELVFVQQYSCAEAARALEVPEGTVKSRIARCKARIVNRRSGLLGWGGMGR